MQVFLVLDDHCAHETGRFVDFAFDCYSSNHVAELDLPALIAEDWHVVRARFADGLRGDNTDGLTELNEVAGGEVATIAHGTHASAALACEHRPDLELLDTDAL